MPRAPMSDADRFATSRRCAHALARNGGDASTSILVAASGVSERTFFRCFETKAGCVRPLLEHGYRRFVAEADHRMRESVTVDILECVRAAFIAAQQQIGDTPLDRSFIRIMLAVPAYRRIWLEINDETATALVVPVADALGLPHDHIDARIAADEATLLAVTAIREMVRTGCDAEDAANHAAAALRRHPITERV